MTVFYDQFLAQGVTDALCDAPFDLSVYTTGIYHPAHIVHRNQSLHRHLSGFDIYQDLRHLGAELENFTAVAVRHLGNILGILKVVAAFGL